MDSQPDFSVKLSAPGKVILFGEYSVVFKKPAIAATLCLRTKLHLHKTDSDRIQINFSALKINISFSLKDIQEYFKISPADCWESYLQWLTNAFECLFEKTYDLSNLSEAQKLSLIAFFHCFLKVFNLKNGFILRIDSELPVGSGVGSSASFSVVLSAAALLLEQHELNSTSGGLIKKQVYSYKDENGKITMSEKFTSQISEIAYSCEKIFHGSPSGVDHTTILHGSMLEFTKTDDNGNKIAPINTDSLKILLVNTNIPRSTKKNVANVKQLKEAHPDIIACVLNGMEEIVRNAVSDLRNFKEDRNKTTKLENHFGDLISLNHNLLRVLGISHPALELIVSTAQKYGLHAKLTGGGGGGFAFIYIPHDTKISLLETIEKELTVSGFTVYDVSLGGPGLTIDEFIA